MIMETEIRSGNQRLFEEHPENWAWALVVDRLEVPLRELANEARAIRPAGSSPHEDAGLCAQRFKSRSRLVELYAEGIAEWTGKDLVAACGGQGKEGDPVRIDERCGEILTACRRIMESEEDLVARSVHPSLARVQFQVAGLSLDVIGPMIGMVASLRRAIRAGETPQLHVEFNARRMKPAPVSGGHPAPVPFQAAPVSPSRNAAASVAGPFATVLVALLSVGIVIFITAHIQTILGIIVILAWFIPVSPLMVALLVVYLLNRR